MFGRVFRRRAITAETAAASVAKGTRLYCIGDIHGRADLLDRVTQFIAEDKKSAPGAIRTIFLGDYIDRGPDSAGVLDRLSRGDFPTDITPLAGNHDRMMLTFLETASSLDAWRGYGALETLRSYGVPLVDIIRGGKYKDAQEALRARVPQHHIDFLTACQLTAESGDYFFCHAGVRPDVPLSDQIPEDLLWIRKPFLDFEGSLGKIIVHGHTRVARPDIRANRINIDTGAFASGMLTCLVLEENTLAIFSTG